MSNQIVISSGAKVRSLEGVLTGTAGIVNALGINVANGIPQLDGSGKILVSQLPNSVMEYKGTWNAATNTPTLVNGTGNQGDVYLCNVAGTVDFGAGPIVFFVGDQVIYSGTIWQRASGASGTVTSVAVTETGDALTITGSPITTSGTINIGFAGTSGQYINGAGGLTTFPSLAGYVTGTGTTNYLSKFTSASDIGDSLVYDNGTNVIIGNGTTDIQGRLQVTTSAGALLLNTDNINFAILFRNTASSNKLWDISSFNNDLVFNEGGVGSRLYLKAGGDVGIGNTTPAYKLDVSGTGRFTGELRLESTITNGTFTYTLPAATGTLALTSDLSGYVTLATTQTISGTKTFSAVLTATNSVNIGGSTGFISDAMLVAQINTPPSSDRYFAVNNNGAYGLVMGYTTTSGRARIANISNSPMTLETNNIVALTLAANQTATFASSVTATSLIKTGGTSSQFLMADGSVNTSVLPSGAYLPLTGGTLTGGLIGTTGSFSSSGSADTFTIAHSSGSGIALNITKGGNGEGLYINKTSGSGNAATIIGTLNATTLVKSGGTSAQILAADGSVITAGTNITISGGTISSTGAITGSGTTNYVTKFTGASSIGNSLIFDNGTNIGIGLTSPSYKLDVQDNGVSGIVDVSSFSVTGNGGSGRGVGILLGAAGSSSSVQVARLVGYHELANPVAVASSFAIQVANSSGVLTERMRVTAAGNVGIGTTNPLASLHVAGAIPEGPSGEGVLMGVQSSFAVIHLNAPSGAGGLIDFSTSGTDYKGRIEYSNSSNFMRFGTDGAERVRITSTGNVGIGTSSPSEITEISRSQNATTRLLVNNADTTNTNSRASIRTNSNGIIGEMVSINGLAVYVGSASNHELSLMTNGSQRMVITNGGNVGIGTSSPTTYSLAGRHLELNDAGGGYAFYHCNSTSVKSFWAANEASALTAIFTFSAHPLTFGTTNTERMRISSGGNVLVGTTTDIGGKLQVLSGNTGEGNAHLQLRGEFYTGYHFLDGTAYYIGQNSAFRALRIYSGATTAVGVNLAAGGTSWGTYSDERLKENIDNIDSVLPRLSTLRTVKYHLKNVDTEDSQKRYGLIAQDLVGKFDEVLNLSKYSDEDTTEYYDVRYTELIPVLVKAIQEQQGQIEELKELIKNK
jgi:hypothetical protein